MSLTNTQYETIRREYDDDRMYAIRSAEQRLAEVYKAIPEYKELSDKTASLSLEHTKRALSGDKSALKELSSSLADLNDKKRSLLAAAGYDPDYVLPRFKCRECKDTGYINGVKCRCFKLKEIALLYEQSNLAGTADSVSFDMLSEKYYSGEDLERFRESKNKAVNFVKNYNSDYQNLLFYGTVGTGKSMLSSCIAGQLLKEGHSVVYFSSADLIDKLAEYTFDRNGSRYEKNDDLIYEDNPIYNCELLIIDDLGTEITNSFTISSLFSLLNSRTLKKRPMIISTNLSLEELQDRYTDRIFSRLTGEFTFCRLSGPDIRIARKLSDQ